MNNNPFGKHLKNAGDTDFCEKILFNVDQFSDLASTNLFPEVNLGSKPPATPAANQPENLKGNHRPNMPGENAGRSFFNNSGTVQGESKDIKSGLVLNTSQKLEPNASSFAFSSSFLGNSLNSTPKLGGKFDSSIANISIIESNQTSKPEASIFGVKNAKIATPSLFEMKANYQTKVHTSPKSSNLNNEGRIEAAALSFGNKSYDKGISESNFEQCAPSKIIEAHEMNTSSAPQVSLGNTQANSELFNNLTFGLNGNGTHLMPTNNAVHQTVSHFEEYQPFINLQNLQTNMFLPNLYYTENLSNLNSQASTETTIDNNQRSKSALSESLINQRNWLLVNPEIDKSKTELFESEKDIFFRKSVEHVINRWKSELDKHVSKFNDLSNKLKRFESYFQQNFDQVSFK